MHIEETKGRFGFHLTGGDDEPLLANPVVQLYVKSSSFSRKADLAISPRLTTEAEIDRFVDDAISALQVVRDDAKSALITAKL